MSNGIRDNDKRIALGSAIKSLGNNRIGGYLISFTDENRRDLYGEFFSSETDLQIEDFPIQGIVTLFHHGFDATIKTRGIGKVDTVKIDDKGVWIEARLKEAEEYVEWVTELLETGELGWSSGALPQAVRVAPNGHIEQWPVIEASITHTPAMPADTRITSIRSLKPVSLRGHHKDDREVTVKTNGGAVSNVTIEYHNTENTQTGERLVNAKTKGKLSKLPALKALDDETRAEILDMIENVVSEYVGLMQEEIRADMGEVDEEAAKVGEDEMVEAIAEVLEDEMVDDGTKAEDGEEEEEMAKSLRKAITSDATIRTIAQAFLRGYTQAAQSKREARRGLIADAINEARFADNGNSKKSQAGGRVGNLGQSNIKVGHDLRYAHLSASDMAFGLLAIRANVTNQPPMVAENPLNYVSEDYMRNLAYKAMSRVKEDVKASGNPGQRQLAVKNWQALKASVPFRADELNASDITGQGLEWVGDYWSNEVWEFAREDSLLERYVAGGMRMQDIPAGTDSIKIPTAGADPVVYSAPEGGDIDTDDNMPAVVANFNAFGTGNVTLTPGQLMLAVSVTKILGEDSVINTGAYVNELMQTVMVEHINKAVINGDQTTTTNNNINLNDGTPGTGISRPYYLVTDGFRHHGIVDTTADARDGGGTLTIADFLETLKLLALPVRSRKQNLLFIIDGNTEAAALALPEIATDDVRRTNATITSGVLQNIYGVDVVTTEHLPLTGTAGTIAAAGGTVGSILLPYLPYWWFGYKRRINLETARNIYAQSDDYVLSVRFGVKRRGADALAMTYNTTT